MTKISNQYSLTNILTADLANSRLGINNVSPTVALDVTGAGKFSSSVGIGGPSLGDILHIMRNGTTSYAAMRVTNSSSTADVYFGIGGSAVGNVDLRNNAYVMNSGASSLAFGTNDTVKMTILSGGNVGIGTSSPTAIVHALKSNATAPTSGTTPSGYALSVGTENGNNGGLWFSADFGGDQGIAGIAGSRVSGYETDLRFYTNNTNSARAFTERMRITAAGNVGIGTSSPARTFTLYATTPVFQFTNPTTGTTSNDGTQFFQSAENFSLELQDNGYFNIYTGGSERMRITSAGNVLVGTTSLPYYGKFNSYINDGNSAGRFVGGPSQGDSNIVLMVDKYSSTNTTSQWFIGFTINNQSVASGVITANGASQAAFGSWSDGRLKENIVDLPNQLSNILALRPVEFDYIESEGGGHQTSFIAQEFEEIYPDAVGQRPDGMKTLTGWGKTEAILVKAIQELSAKVSLLENK